MTGVQTCALPISYYNSDESEKHYTKSKKPNRKERYTLYDSMYMKYPEQTNPQGQERDQWLPGAEGKRSWEGLFIGTGFTGVMKICWN